MKWQAIRFTIVFLLIAGVITKTGKPIDNQPKIDVAVKAPDFQLKNLKGKNCKLTELIGPQGVLICFWATWADTAPVDRCVCVGPGKCDRRPLLPYLKKLDHKYRKRHLNLLVISIDINSDRLKKQLKKDNFILPVLLDPELRAANLYKVVSLPAIFLIDKQAVVRYIDDEFLPGTEDETRLEAEVSKITKSNQKH